MKTPLDVLLITLPLAGFACMCGGYGLPIRQALDSHDRKRAFSRILDWRGHEHEVNPLALRLIYTGAFIGFIFFVVLFIILST